MENDGDDEDDRGSTISIKAALERWRKPSKSDREQLSTTEPNISDHNDNAHDQNDPHRNAIHQNQVNDNEQIPNNNSNNNSNNPPEEYNENGGQLGEMQIKLDIAAAQLLTEEMRITDLTEKFEVERLCWKDRVDALECETAEFRARQMNGEGDGGNGESDDNHRPHQTSSQNRGEEEDANANAAVVEELDAELGRVLANAEMERERWEKERRVMERQMGDQEERIIDSGEEVLRYKRMAEHLEADMVVMTDAAKKAEAKDLNSEGGGANDNDKGRQQQQKLSRELENSKRQIKEIKKEIGIITFDFGELAEETERLEKELEAVTEDRDELLRRSIAYPPQQPSSAASPSSSHQPSSGGDSNLSPSLSTSKHHNEVDDTVIKRMDEQRLQHQTEIQRMRKALHQHETTLKEKDDRILELEQMVSNTKAFDLTLDLSSIDNIDGHSSLPLESKKLKRDLDLANREIDKMMKEREELRACLSDAMQELEYMEAVEAERKQHSAVSQPSDEMEEGASQDLVQMLFERDEAIARLTSCLEKEKKEGASQDVAQMLLERDDAIARLTSCLEKKEKLSPPREDEVEHVRTKNLRAELNAMVDWLNSSVADEMVGNPSIECVLDQPDMKSGESEAAGHHLSIKDTPTSSSDDPMVQSVYRHCLSMRNRLVSTEVRLSTAKKQLRDARNIPTTDHQPRQLFLDELEAVQEDVRNKDVVNENLRKDLKEAVDLIRPLQEHVKALKERQDELIMEDYPTKRKIQNETKEADIEHSDSATELRGEKLSMLDLQVEVRQLRAQIQAADNELIQSRQAIDEFDGISTPKKCNKSRGKERDRSWRNTAQSSNEEEDRQSPHVDPDSELKKVKDELQKKTVDEEALMTMIRESSDKVNALKVHAEKLERANEAYCQQEKDLEFTKFTLETDLARSTKETMKAHEKITRLESELQVTIMNAGGFPDLASELQATRVDLERREKSEKKLKKSLSEAVNMLNTLRNHVLAEEKERKKMKRRLKSSSSKGVDCNTSINSSGPEIMTMMSSDSDRKEDQVMILQLKSHIVAMEHQITCLQERVVDMEAFHPTSSGLPSDQEKIYKLEEQLREAERAHEVTKSMLEEISDINKELLSDLKQTETEGVEILDELEIVKEKLRISEEEIDNAKYIAASAIRKFDELIDKEREKGSAVSGSSGVRSFGSIRSSEPRTLTGYINKLSKHVNIVMERNSAVEVSFGKK